MHIGIITQPSLADELWAADMQCLATGQINLQPHLKWEFPKLYVTWMFWICVQIFGLFEYCTQKYNKDDNYSVGQARC